MIRKRKKFVEDTHWRWDPISKDSVFNDGDTHVKKMSMWKICVQSGVSWREVCLSLWGEFLRASWRLNLSVESIGGANMSERKEKILSAGAVLYESWKEHRSCRKWWEISSCWKSGVFVCVYLYERVCEMCVLCIVARGCGAWWRHSSIFCFTSSA